MSQKEALYFIAIIPPEFIREPVEAFKRIMKTKFQAEHAQKSPVHITLQRPFRRPPSMEKSLIEILKGFSFAQKKFHIQLSGFGAFTPRVIYVKPKNVKPIMDLHAKLYDKLLENSFLSKEMNDNINPHLTIATRDLSEANFSLAWSYFENYAYDASFEVQCITLLKHNGNTWDVLKEFPFD